MGNRAIVKSCGSNMGVYLHWNGGRDSVEAFLKYCEMRGFRPFGGPGSDGYGFARFMQVVGNFFGGDLSLGICTNVYMNENSSPGDNGIYEVSGWEIVDRYPRGIHEQRRYKLEDMLIGIDKCQPVNDRLGASYIKAKEVSTSQLRIGDTVFIYDSLEYKGRKMKKFKVIGMGQPGKWVNGHRVDGVPYVNRWDSPHPEDNPNNYLFDKTCRAITRRRKKEE